MAVLFCLYLIFPDKIKLLELKDASGKKYKIEIMSKIEKIPSVIAKINKEERFHQTETYSVSQWKDNEPSICHQCHRFYPHLKTKTYRAFLNMHIEKLSCLTCHLPNGKIDKINFGWYNKEKGLLDVRNENIPAGSKIVPYKKLNGKIKIVDGKEDEDKFIKRMVCSSEGCSCNKCHSEVGIINFKDLGYGEKKVETLINMNVLKMLKETERWYMPGVF